MNSESNEHLKLVCVYTYSHNTFKSVSFPICILSFAILVIPILKERLKTKTRENHVLEKNLNLGE